MFLNISEPRKTKSYLKRREACDDNFKSLYRFTKRNVDWLANHFLGDDNGESRGSRLTNSQRMRTFLRYIGDPGFQVGVGEDIGIHQTTANKIIWEVCEKIIARSEEWIKFPTTETEMKEAQALWQQKLKFPHAIAAVDCTHVLIVTPHTHGDEFVNRKGLKSFNVQATCNAKKIFTSLDCSWPGSVHDSRIWRNSAVRQVMAENSSGAIILGDEGYAIAPWLLTTYRDPRTPAQVAYNKLHKAERVIIECAFGQVKRRFPILSSTIRMKTSRVPSMILACFILHNVAKYLNDEDFSFEIELQDQLGNRHDDPQNLSEKQRGEARRDAIAQLLS